MHGWHDGTVGMVGMVGMVGLVGECNFHAAAALRLFVGVSQDFA